MKFKLTLNLLVFSLVFFALAGCVKENTPTMTTENVSIYSSATLIASGMFVSNDHPTSGEVEVYTQNGDQLLRFRNFKSDNSPDLRVYLSVNEGISDAIELGDLKVISGEFTYTFNTNIDVANYNRVLIWCEDFSVLFGNATLK